MSVLLSIYLFTYISVIYIENTRTPMTQFRHVLVESILFRLAEAFQELQILVDIPDSFGRSLEAGPSRGGPY
jgi:hypothetical protein